MSEFFRTKIPLVIAERLQQHYGSRSFEEAVARCLLEKIAEEWGEPLAKSLKVRYYNSLGVILPERKTKVPVTKRHERLRIKIVS